MSIRFSKITEYSDIQIQCVKVPPPTIYNQNYNMSPFLNSYFLHLVVVASQGTVLASLSLVCVIIVVLTLACAPCRGRRVWIPGEARQWPAP